LHTALYYVKYIPRILFGKNDQYSTVKLLLEKEVDVNVLDKNGKTPLHWAAGRRGYDSIVKLLLEKGVDVNVLDKNGWTPLHYTAESGEYTTVKLLLKKGADVNAQTKDGKTPLYLAEANRQDDSIITLLLQAETQQAAFTSQTTAVQEKYTVINTQSVTSNNNNTNTGKSEQDQSPQGIQ
jgi:ankyrin repeat protein